MKAVIDSNIIIDLFNGIKLAEDEINKYDTPIISVITWIEVLVGAQNESEKAAIQQFLKKFIIAEIDTIIGLEACKIRQENRIKLPDAIIEATARVNNTILVTRNIKDFDGNSPYIHIPYSLN